MFGPEFMYKHWYFKYDESFAKRISRKLLWTKDFMEFKLKKNIICFLIIHWVNLSIEPQFSLSDFNN